MKITKALQSHQLNFETQRNQHCYSYRIQIIKITQFSLFEINALRIAHSIVLCVFLMNDRT